MRLIAENLCLRQQLLVLQRRHPQPRLANADRRFWIIAYRRFSSWRGSLLIVKPETVLRWHRGGWRAHWSWRSCRQRGRSGRRPILQELQALIRRMTAENRLWGQKRIQAELARLGFTVSARTVAKYMNSRHSRGPSSPWRKFLKRHGSSIWVCDFFCVQTTLFQTLYVFFVIRHVNREILHVAITPFPTAEWVAQQIVERCAWDRLPPRFLIHDRDSRYVATFDRRLRGLGTKQVRTPFRAPRANAISERWVKSVRTDRLDHLLVFNEAHLGVPRISIIGVRTGHLVNALPGSPLCISFDLEGPTARSRPSPSWVACITSIGVLRDGLYFCALQPIESSFSLRSNSYRRRHSLPPAGVTYRCRPPPSVSL
jgi:transposase InsO family protein